MEAGLYYVSEIKPEYAQAEANVKAAEKAKKKRIDDLYDALPKMVKDILGIDAKLIDKDYGDPQFQLIPGVTLHLDISELAKTHPLRKHMEQEELIEKEVSDLCEVRCDLDSMLSTQRINGFKSYVRSIHGAKATLPQLAVCLKDYRLRFGNHTCPVKKKR